MPSTIESAATAAREAFQEKMSAMSFLDHLEELRKRIIWSIAAVGIAFLLCWHWAETIYGYMEAPIMKALAMNHLEQKLVYLNPTEPFNMYMKIGLIAALFVASPFVLYQLWAFVAPGLYRHEKKYVMPFMISSVGLFLGGGFFGYKVVYPAALTFLIEQGKHFTPMITIGEYTDLFLTIIIGLGVVFEMPILIFFLSLIGIVSPRWMWNNFRYSILVIFIIAAILTPTTDIMNMCVFSAPMIGLYLISIGVAWLVHPKRRRAKEEAE